MKGIILLIFSFLFFCSYAGSIERKDNYHGVYISGGISNVIRSDVLESEGVNGVVFFRAPAGENTVGLNVSLGYRTVVHRFLLDGDVVFRFIPGTSSGVLLSGIRVPRVSTYAFLGAEFRPGVLITDRIALYAIIGLESATYKVRYLFNSTNTTFSGWEVGPGFGLGLNVALNDKLSMQFDYLYTYLSRLNYTDAGNNSFVHLDPKINIITLSLSYLY